MNGRLVWSTTLTQGIQKKLSVNVKNTSSRVQ
jgi:hypothetical protein